MVGGTCNGAKPLVTLPQSIVLQCIDTLMKLLAI